MNAPVAVSIKEYVLQCARHAHEGMASLSTASNEQRSDALRAAAAALRQSAPAILTANAQDVDVAQQAGRPESFIDRLALNEERIEGMASGLEAIAELEDPLGKVLATFNRPNGLLIERVAVPLGVIGMVFEARPNVAADASGLCIKSGNGIVLRAGSDSRASSRAIVECMQRGLASAGLSGNAVQLLDTPDREAVTQLLRCDEYIDLVIPRGGRGLVELVRDQATVPTLLHLDGNCHTYIHAEADAERAVSVVCNAKLRRTGICGATESVLIDAERVSELMPKLIDAMPACEFRGDALCQQADDRVLAASESDYASEFLAPVLSVRSVSGIDEAIDLVAQYSSKHTDAIITEDTEAAEKFLAAVDSAVVMHNCSTQFSDGGEFGMGAEIGIATGKLHARGPVGVEQLTTYKYLVRGSGQVRP